jgi:hypothetical protein
LVRHRSPVLAQPSGAVRPCRCRSAGGEGDPKPAHQGEGAIPGGVANALRRSRSYGDLAGIRSRARKFKRRYALMTQMHADRTLRPRDRASRASACIRVICLHLRLILSCAGACRAVPASEGMSSGKRQQQGEDCLAEDAGTWVNSPLIDCRRRRDQGNTTSSEGRRILEPRMNTDQHEYGRRADVDAATASASFV